MFRKLSAVRTKRALPTSRQARRTQQHNERGIVTSAACTGGCMGSLQRKETPMRSVFSAACTTLAKADHQTLPKRGGCMPVPKEKLVRSLAVRGPTVVMDEYNTSKMCPCGTSELKNVHESHRLRCHKTVGLDGPCCVECSLGAENMDRDVLAIINFLLCARCALDGKERPGHLRGPWRFQ